jgi:8-oxo-dGTP pyrophosphatase MutT (NUDIX family)
MMSATEPTIRLAARAILIDDLDRVLLFRAVVPGERQRFIWITPGGGINAGEEESVCVRREVFEETGLRNAEVGPCVWRRDHTFRWGDGVLRQVEAYYLVRTAAFEVNVENQEDLERSFLSGHRWFSLEELAAHEEVVVPANFAELLAPLLRGELPDKPIQVGI